MCNTSLDCIGKIIEDEHTTVRVYLLKKARGKNDYSAVIFPNSIEESIKRTYSSNYFSLCENNKGIVEYDTVHSERGMVKMLPTKNVDNLPSFLSAISDADKNKNILSKDNFSDTYSAVAMVYEYKSNNTVNKITIISKYKKVDTWFKKGIKFCFIGNTVTEKNEEIFVLNGCIDVIVFKDELLIFNENSFEYIFNYYVKSKNFIENKREEIENWSFINNPVEFYKSVSSSKSSVIILARALSKTQSKLLNLPANEIRDILSRYPEFSALKFDASNRIIFDKSTKNIILCILRSTYSRDLFSDSLIQTKGV